MPLYNYGAGNVDPRNFLIGGEASPFQQFTADSFLNARRAIPGWMPRGQGREWNEQLGGWQPIGQSPGAMPRVVDDTSGLPPMGSNLPGFNAPSMGVAGIGALGGQGYGGGSPYQFPAMTYPTPGSNMIGGPVSGSASNWTPQYGGVPNVANPLMGEAGALLGNTANFPLISQMAGGINQLQQGQLLANYEQAFPGFGSRMAEGSQGIGYNLAGTVDPYEMSQMARGAAERGLAMGQPGSTPMTNEAYLSAIGQTAAQRRALGQQQLNARIAATPVVQPYDITRDLVTGAQLTDAANMANLYAAAPVPTAQAAEEQRMADLAMSRGLSAQDWLAERNYGRSQQEQAINYARGLQSMVLGGQLSEQQAQRAWDRAMKYLEASRAPTQNRPFYTGGMYPYNRGRGGFDLGADLGALGGGAPRVGGPTTSGLLTPEQTKYYYDQWYGTGVGGAGAPGTPTSYYDPFTQTSNQFPVNPFAGITGPGAVSGAWQGPLGQGPWQGPLQQGGATPEQEAFAASQDSYRYGGIPDVIPGAPSGYGPGSMPYTGDLQGPYNIGVGARQGPYLSPGFQGPPRPTVGMFDQWNFSPQEYYNQLQISPEDNLMQLFGF